jgi:hypothetical protein
LLDTKFEARSAQNSKKLIRMGVWVERYSRSEQITTITIFQGILREKGNNRIICASLFPQKAAPARPTQVADHLVPNQISVVFEFFRERERGKFSIFKGLQKPLSAQIQGN